MPEEETTVVGFVDAEAMVFESKDAVGVGGGMVGETPMGTIGGS